jgi:hypothetical protein
VQGELEHAREHVERAGADLITGSIAAAFVILHVVAKNLPKSGTYTRYTSTSELLHGW